MIRFIGQMPQDTFAALVQRNPLHVATYDDGVRVMHALDKRDVLFASVATS